MQRYLLAASGGVLDIVDVAVLWGIHASPTSKAAAQGLEVVDW